MNTNKKTVSTLGDVKINVKIKLSALWVTLMLFYVYADILGFYTPGNIEKVVSGEIGGVQINEGFIFVMAIWMALPSVMVFLSLTLKAKANRRVNSRRYILHHCARSHLLCRRIFRSLYVSSNCRRCAYCINCLACMELA
jgi:hypothetical protein